MTKINGVSFILVTQKLKKTHSFLCNLKENNHKHINSRMFYIYFLNNMNYGMDNMQNKTIFLVKSLVYNYLQVLELIVKIILIYLHANLMNLLLLLVHLQILLLHLLLKNRLPQNSKVYAKN